MNVPASTKWFLKGFALGAGGAKESRRKGRPRLRAMVPHWKLGVRTGAFCARSFGWAHTKGLLK